VNNKKREQMNKFKRIAAFALGLGSGLAAGYLTRPRHRNKLRPQIITDDLNEKDNQQTAEKSKKLEPA
jgi:hypothetical protein